MADLRSVFLSRIGRISLIFLSVFVALCAINYISLPFAPCIQPQVVRETDNSKKDADEKHVCPEAYGVVSAGLNQITDWTPETWTAAATIMLALCTLVLASATSRQIQLARDEFIATNRPLLRVRRFRRAEASANDARIGINFSIVNVGNSDALLRESRGGIDLVPPTVVPMPVYDGLPQVIEPRMFAPGTTGEGFIMARPDRQRGVILRVYGYLSYVDGLGNVRTTAFCRYFNNATSRFDVVENPDSEYED